MRSGNQMDSQGVQPPAVKAEEHLGLAHLCAKRFFRHGMEYDELVREATLSLVAAAARFDPSRGVHFSTYAVPCLLHDLRRACERGDPMHVPRTQRQLLRQVETLRREHITQDGQEPSLDALAKEMDLPAEELGAVVAAKRQMETLRYASREETREGAMLLAEGESAWFVDYLLLLDVIARLPKPMPRLIQLRFMGSCTQQATAKALHMSQAQVSKLEKRAKQALEESLAYG